MIDAIRSALYINNENRNNRKGRAVDDAIKERFDSIQRQIDDLNRTAEATNARLAKIDSTLHAMNLRLEAHLAQQAQICKSCNDRLVELEATVYAKHEITIYGDGESKKGLVGRLANVEFNLKIAATIVLLYVGAIITTHVRTTYNDHPTRPIKAIETAVR